MRFILSLLRWLISWFRKEENSEEKKNLQSVEADQSLPAYKKCDFLMTRAERSFLGILRQVVKQEDSIFCKVRMEDVINVNPEHSFRIRSGNRNRIKSRHVDFLICNTKDTAIKAAIELDDKSHNSKKRIERDTFVNASFKEAGIPLLRFKVKLAYTINEIEELIDSI